MRYFLLLMLENNWEKWTAIAKTASPNKEEEKEEDMDASTEEHVPVLKWTSNAFHGGRNPGWPKEAKEEFAKLHDKVAKNQEVHTNTNVEELILEAWKLEGGTKTKKMTKKPETLVPHDDFF